MCSFGRGSGGMEPSRGRAHRRKHNRRSDCCPAAAGHKCPWRKCFGGGQGQDCQGGSSNYPSKYSFGLTVNLHTDSCRVGPNMAEIVILRTCPVDQRYTYPSTFQAPSSPSEICISRKEMARSHSVEPSRWPVSSL